jgi:hypothetical protein
VGLIVDGDKAIYKTNGQELNETVAMKRWDEVSQVWQPLSERRMLLRAGGAELLSPRQPACGGGRLAVWKRKVTNEKLET